VVTVLVDVPAGDLVPGDVIVLPNGLVREVRRLEIFDEATGPHPGVRIRPIVAGSSSLAYENRASAARGPSSIAVDEQGLRPFRPHELVRVERA
jgi:hypothetical protein